MSPSSGSPRAFRPIVVITRALGQMVAVTALAVTMILVPQAPALAHTFTLVAVVPDGDRDARDGFQLAVDESPDVTHPPGVDAGDHLGGIDVDIVYVEAGDVAQVRTALREGARVVAVLSGNDSVAAVGAMAGIDRAFVTTAGAGQSRQPGWVVLVDGPGQGPRVEAFRARFRSAYGRVPSPEALRGYDAARVIEMAVVAAGEQISRSTADSFVPDSSRLVGSTAVVNRQDGQGARAPVAQEQSGRDRSPVVPVVVVVALGATAAVAATLIRRRRSM